MFINNFDPVAFQVFSFEIRWYSLAYVFGIIFGWTYCKKKLIKDQKLLNLFDDLITYLIIGIIVGGRLGYVIFYNLEYYLKNFSLNLIGCSFFFNSLINIIKGDRSDGVPNVLSPDDTFTESKRQKPIRKTMLITLTEAMDKWEPKDLFQLAKCNRDTWVRNWQRNETLIDLDKIPQDIRDEILREFNNAPTGDRSKLFNYFVEKKLNNLIQSIGDF